MSLVVSWLAFPIVLGLLSLGCGLLVQRAAGLQRFPRELLMPLGFATIVVLSLFATSNSTTASFTTPLLVACAVAGLAFAYPWRPGRGIIWPAASAIGAYAAFGAPIFLSGSATLAGYIKLDDTATWLAFSDRLVEHGRDASGLAPSSYEATLAINWAGGYPVGAFPPLGVAHELLGTDSAWLFQPYVAFLAAMLALGLYGLLARVIEPLPLRAGAAFVASQPALLYGYSLWGGVKEVATAAILVLLAALTPLALRPDTRMRSVLPLAMATAALLGVLSFFGAVWIAPILIPALVAGLYLRRWAFVPITAAFVAFAAILSLPTFRLVGEFSAAKGTLTTGDDLGNLIQPLSNLQVFGIWPVGDFRVRPHDITLTYILVGILAVGALAGLWWAWRRRGWGLLLYVAGTTTGCAVTVAVGSAWVDGKALAIASPAALVAAMAAVAWLVRSGRRTEGVIALLIVGGGVLWSNALAYHDVWLAPRSQLQELQTIGDRFSGDGPALMTEYSPFGVRHFLRSLDPEGASELRRRPVLLNNGEQVPKGGYADIDRFRLDQILVYRTLVLSHSPSASRPPSVYKRVWSGRYYEVWQRPEPSPATIIAHVPFGSDLQPSAVPPCSEVLRIGREAAARNGRLATVIRPAVTVVSLSSAGSAPQWSASGDDPGAVYPPASGSLETALTAPATGRYQLWLAGSFPRQLRVSLDGQATATAQNHLNHPGIDTPLGQAELTAGRHSVGLRTSPRNLVPGSGGAPFALGPLVLSRVAADPPVTYVQPAGARSLCGKRLDWLEAIAR